MTVKPFEQWRKFWRQELRWRNLWFIEKNPTKFATTAWLQSQLPFMIYRVVCFIYTASVLSWSIYTASQLPTEHNEVTWFLSYPVWGFMLFTVYNTLALLLAGLNFNYDCLCNDDLSWYHKVSWVLHVVSFNSTVSCLFGTIVYAISMSASDDTGMTLAEAFNSNDINFYIICALVMAIDVFVCSIPIRFLHFVYSVFFFVVYVLIHVYRWAAGYVPTHTIFSFTTLPSATIVLFTLFTAFLYIPVVHLLACGIDAMRKNLILKIRKRHRREILHAANLSVSPLTPEDRCERKPMHTLRYKTSAMRPRLEVSRDSKSTGRHGHSRGTLENYRASTSSRQSKTRERPGCSGYAEPICREMNIFEKCEMTTYRRDDYEKHKIMNISRRSKEAETPGDCKDTERKFERMKKFEENLMTETLRLSDSQQVRRKFEMMKYFGEDETTETSAPGDSEIVARKMEMTDNFEENQTKETPTLSDLGNAEGKFEMANNFTESQTTITVGDSVEAERNVKMTNNFDESQTIDTTTLSGSGNVEKNLEITNYFDKSQREKTPVPEDSDITENNFELVNKSDKSQTTEAFTSNEARYAEKTVTTSNK